MNLNGADIVVIIIIAALIALAVIIMQRNRKKGRRGCGGECSSCRGCEKSNQKK